MGLKTGRWTSSEIDFLHINKRMSYVDIAERLGRKYHSVLHQALKLGLRKKRRWSHKELELLKEIYPTGQKKRILREIKRTWEATVKRAADLGIYRGALLSPLEKLPNLVLNEKSKVWIACAIDCEGSLGLGLTKRGFYYPYISINNTKRALLNHFRKLVGCIHKTIRFDNKRCENRKNIYQLDMGSAPWIYALLRQIRPYFIIKGKQADLVLEFIEILDNIKRNNNGKIAYTERVHEIYGALKKLNKKGKK
jgi:hypothetical protein